MNLTGVGKSDSDIHLRHIQTRGKRPNRTSYMSGSFDKMGKLWTFCILLLSGDIVGKFVYVIECIPDANNCEQTRLHALLLLACVECAMPESNTKLERQRFCIKNRPLRIHSSDFIVPRILKPHDLI